MYTQDDYNVVCRMLKKRWWLTALPAALLLIAAVAVFVYGQLNRNNVLWKLTAALTVIGGSSTACMCALCASTASTSPTCSMAACA